MQKITGIILGMFLISIGSAITIYSGDTVYYDFTKEVDIIQKITWEVVDNSSNLNGLNITTNLTGATMSLDPLFKPDNFTIIFTIIGQNEKADVTVHRSRGSSCKYNQDFDWNCSEWGECVDEIQTRICKERNNCGGSYGKPIEIQNCTSDEKMDEHGCMLTEGYAWCESKQRCIRTLEEECEEEIDDEEEQSRLPLYILFSSLVLMILLLIVWILHKKISLKRSKITE